MIQNHPSYSGMKIPQTCPQPTFIGGFNETINNTDESDGSDIIIEHTFDQEMMTFSARKCISVFNENDLLIFFVV